MARYCMQCDDGTVLVHERRDIEFEHRNHRDTVHGVSGWHCPACGEIESDPDEAERYERGEARPMPAVVNLFRLLDKHPELLSELRQG